MAYLNDRNLVPESAIAQLERLVKLCEQTLEKTLLGLILHGSASTAGFEIERSDLDVLAIIDGKLTAEQSLGLGKGMLSVSNKPHALEFSAIAEQALENWTHPCRHQFHYGEDQRTAFSEGRFKPETLVDEDLATHFTMARARGVDLMGSYPISRLPQVPETDYLSAILSDIEWAQTQQGLDQYEIANACRTMAYLQSGALLSKSEGIAWCRENDVDMAGVVELVTNELHLKLGK